MLKHFPKHIVEPEKLIETENFVVTLAKNHEDVEKAQRLRYEIFNVEQKRGLKDAEKYGIDFDEFDEYCLHLLAIEKKTNNVVGTYRVHLGHIANSAKGFYSSREYEIHGLYKVADKCMELGRTCVSPHYRSGSVIALLWGGITEIMVRGNFRYMLGCVSLEETNPRIGWAMYEYISRQFPNGKDFSVIPRPGFILKRPPDNEIDNLLKDESTIRKLIPPLFKGYLRIGGVICGQPALDREFGTIDFFIVVDITKVPERYQNHFNYREKKD